MKEAFIVVPGKPRGKERPRVVYGRAYTPQKTKDYEDLIRWHYRAARPGRFEGAIEVNVCAYFRPPKSLSMKKAKALIGTPYLHAPDIDNVYKIVLDALNGIAWEDDRQVCKGTVTKYYGFRDSIGIEIKEVPV